MSFVPLFLFQCPEDLAERPVEHQIGFRIKGRLVPVHQRQPAAAQMRMNKCADVVPQDVTAEDTVTFVWELA